jgi:hypothetical protein
LDRIDGISNFYKDQLPIKWGEIASLCDGRVQYALVGTEPSQQKTATLYLFRIAVEAKKYNPKSFSISTEQAGVTLPYSGILASTGILCCAARFHISEAICAVSCFYSSQKMSY